ncbi:nitrous oxide reductase accessory protein NosL [Desulfomonile tiedjei]|uniref:Putative lipoprotein involved in nitrous oxide reduction n=1 Tax=Desulfomonile tiedjei (strain ATCC 49306 / DSM 6799 / DCB-1) TaxID=706587 RepID=I4C1F2_DESTA|nr:nitrous oxide reductase accessory protein NosL [Desulfomonile tiedjei]AFM23393.1 putative lipoprotein involved in nitrous oxide reduction [Desulfomonile tiedjei DSM 6799]
MRLCSRREFNLIALAVITLVLLQAGPLLADDPCAVQHPFMPPKAEFVGQCPNCGMMRGMWARTWMEFENSSGKHGVCSIHCLAHMAIKAGEKPRSVQTALYMAPEKMVPANTAWFVVGSKAKGTMTMNSKIAFPSKDEAEAFARSCEGKVSSFQDTFALARADLPKENAMIAEKRVKDGKIIEPIDNKDECAVCRMYPARYSKHKCQLIDKDKKVHHFCSTQCLFRFLGNPREFVNNDTKPAMIWVTDYQSGSWISAKTAYYLVGSRIQGPMGHEALAFDKNAEALSTAHQQGGDVLVFSEVGIQRIEAKE